MSAAADPYTAAQIAAEAHLAALDEELFDTGAVTHVPALAPYCGCQTCVVRAVLFAASPYFAAIAADQESAAP